jgi:hypothetical protein
MTLARLGALLIGADDSRRWRLAAEFLEEYRWEPAETRGALLTQEPARTGDEHWDVLLAALASIWRPRTAAQALEAAPLNMKRNRCPAP